MKMKMGKKREKGNRNEKKIGGEKEKVRRRGRGGGKERNRRKGQEEER